MSSQVEALGLSGKGPWLPAKEALRGPDDLEMRKLPRDGVAVSLPILLDILTVFFIVGGCALLWLNLRPRRPHNVITKTDDTMIPNADGISQASSEHALDNREIHPLLDVLQRHLAEAEAIRGTKDNSDEDQVAEVIVKVKTPPN